MGVAGGQPTAAATGHAPAVSAGDVSGGSSPAAVLLVRQTNESATGDTDAGAGNETNGTESDGGTNRTQNRTDGNGTVENGTAGNATADEPPLIESFTATVEGTDLTVRVESSEQLRQIAVAVYDMDGDEVAARESNFHVGTAYVTTFDLANGTYRTSLVTARSYDRRVETPTSHYALVTVPESGSNETDSTTTERQPTTEANGSDRETETTADTERSTTSKPAPTTSSSASTDTETSREARGTAASTAPPATRATPADDPGSESRPRTQGALLGSPFLQSVLTLVAAAVLALLSVVLWVRG